MPTIYCPCCGAELGDTGDSGECAGHYVLLGSPGEDEAASAERYSWDCLCRACGFSFVIESDHPVESCPLSRFFGPQPYQRR